MKHPTDANIIINLYKKTRNDIIKWYNAAQNSNNKTDYIVWKSSEKLTTKKSLSYSIYHRKDNPIETHLVIYLDKRTSEKTSISIKVKTIKSPIIMTLIKKIMEKLGFKIINSVVSIINDKYDKNKILLLKRYSFDNTLSNKWCLPGGKLNDNETVENCIKREIKEETNLYVNELEKIDYRNIIKLNKKYYMIHVYHIKKYNGTLYDYPIDEIENARWVHIDDIFNYDIGKETLKVLNFYKDNEHLPF